MGFSPLYCEGCSYAQRDQGTLRWVADHVIVFATPKVPGLFALKSMALLHHCSWAPWNLFPPFEFSHNDPEWWPMPRRRCGKFYVDGIPKSRCPLDHMPDKAHEDLNLGPLTWHLSFSPLHPHWTIVAQPLVYKQPPNGISNKRGNSILSGLRCSFILMSFFNTLFSSDIFHHTISISRSRKINVFPAGETWGTNAASLCCQPNLLWRRGKILKMAMSMLWMLHPAWSNFLWSI